MKGLLVLPAILAASGCMMLGYSRSAQEAMDAAIAECHRIAGNNDTENAKFIQCMRTGRGTDILQGRSAAYAEHRKQESFGEAATDDAGAWVWQWKRMLGLDQSR